MWVRVEKGVSAALASPHAGYSWMIKWAAALGRPEFAEGMGGDQRDEMRRGCAGRRDCVRLGHEGDDMLRNMRFGVGMRCSVG